MDGKRNADDVRMGVAIAIGRFVLGAGAGFVIWWFALYVAHFDLPGWAFTGRCILVIVLVCGLIGLALPRFASSAWSGLWKAIRGWWWWD